MPSGPTTGISSFLAACDAGNSLVPSPAIGMTAFFAAFTPLRHRPTSRATRPRLEPNSNAPGDVPKTRRGSRQCAAHAPRSSGASSPAQLPSRPKTATVPPAPPPVILAPYSPFFTPRRRTASTRASTSGTERRRRAIASPCTRTFLSPAATHPDSSPPRPRGARR